MPTLMCCTPSPYDVGLTLVKKPSGSSWDRYRVSGTNNCKMGRHQIRSLSTHIPPQSSEIGSAATTGWDIWCDYTLKDLSALILIGVSVKNYCSSACKSSDTYQCLLFRPPSKVLIMNRWNTSRRCIRLTLSNPCLFGQRESPVQILTKISGWLQDRLHCTYILLLWLRLRPGRLLFTKDFFS